MDIWHYDRVTGELIGHDVADPDPMNPGGFLHPAWTTPIEPPAPEAGKVRVFFGVWTQVADRRNESWWRTVAHRADHERLN
jgi:hypothetical protein